MASKTSFLSLIKANNGEYKDSWDTILNQNFDLLDEAIETNTVETEEARGTTSSLSERLSVSLNPDGSLKPSEEVDLARNSPVYGDDFGGVDYSLKGRIDKADWELFYAREGNSSLLDSLAYRLQDRNYPDCVIEGPKTPTATPNFLSSSGSEFLLNGDPTPVEFNIAGRIMKLYDDISIPVTGANGTKYLVAKKPATPFISLDKSVAEQGVCSANALNNNKIQIFQDITTNFTATRIRPGMILKILNTQNAGEYVIAQVAFDSNVNKLRIIGNFVQSIGSVNYQILDPLRPEFSIETTYTPTNGWCYVGEGEYNGGSLISDLTYAFKNQYESTFESIDVSSVATFQKTFNHNLGFVPRFIKVFACQDENSYWEELSVSDVANDLTISTNNTVSFNPGTSDATYAGTITSTLNGTVFPARSVAYQVSKTQIVVKNIRDNHFYKDFSGTMRTIGKIKVVCRK